MSTIAACVAGAITWATHAVGFFGTTSQDDEEGPSPATAIALMVIGPLAATLIQLGISRSREYLADETGAYVSGDPLALASALARLESAAHAMPASGAELATASLFIVNPLTGAPRMARLFSTHPSTEERIARLETISGRRIAA